MVSNPTLPLFIEGVRRNRERVKSKIIKSKMNNFTIIGIDDKDHPELPEQARAAIATHHVFSGGKRHHEIMRDNPNSPSVYRGSTAEPGES